ncbi:MAG TPA: dephospho-CoA kinase [Limnochordales bacterium]
MGAEPLRRPYVLGVTGGFASGKSTVMAILRELGAFTIDADQVVHELSRPGGPVWEAIRRAFGPGVLDARGQLRRAELRRRIFQDPQARELLNRVTHPIILEELRRRIEQALRGPAPVVAVEIPLLYEVGEPARRLVDGVLVVWADDAACQERARARGLSAQEAEAAIHAQMPLERKRQLADFVVDNSDGRDYTRRQLQELWGLWTGRAHRPGGP